MRITVMFERVQVDDKSQTALKVSCRFKGEFSGDLRSRDSDRLLIG